VSHHRHAGADDRPRAVDGGAAALELHSVHTCLLDEAVGVLDRLLVGALVGAEGHVADQQRGLQPTADGLGEHEHLVHADGRRALMAQHDHRGAVAYQHDVDAGLLGDLGRRVVVCGDHHDRLAVALHLLDPRQRHRDAVAGGVGRVVGGDGLAWTGAHGVTSAVEPSSRTEGSLSTAVM
jgi:hypothetical protein